MIAPTVGRVVWFYTYSPGQGHKGPLSASVARVWNDRMVNLGYLDQDGNHHAATSVALVQEGDEAPQANYCTWMPYQIGQAKKHEEK